MKKAVSVKRKLSQIISEMGKEEYGYGRFTRGKLLSAMGYIIGDAMFMGCKF